MTGRPTKYNEELQTKICKLIERGDRPEVAAGVNGISRNTYYLWMRENEAFSTAVARALDVFESESTRIVIEGDDKSWSVGPAKMRLEVLSRRMPRHWAQQVKHHVEKVETEFFDVLQAICFDPAIHARVREEKDCGFIFTALCEEISRRDSEGETGEDQEESRVH